MPHGDLEVYLEGALEIKDSSIFGKGSPYCVLTVGQQAFTSTVAPAGGSRPYWGQTFRFNIDRSTTDLQIHIYNKNNLRDDDLLGQSTLAFSKVFHDGPQVPITSYAVTRSSGKVQGKVNLRLTFYARRRPQPQPPPPGTDEPLFQRGRPPPQAYTPPVNRFESASPRSMANRNISQHTDDESNDGSGRRYFDRHGSIGSRFSEPADGFDDDYGEPEDEPAYNAYQPAEPPARVHSLPVTHHPPAGPQQLRETRSMPPPRAAAAGPRRQAEEPGRAAKHMPPMAGPSDAPMWPPRGPQYEEHYEAEERSAGSRGRRSAEELQSGKPAGRGSARPPPSRLGGPVQHSPSPSLGGDEIPGKAQSGSARHSPSPSMDQGRVDLRPGPKLDGRNLKSVGGPPSRMDPRADYSFAEPFVPSPPSVRPNAAGRSSLETGEISTAARLSMNAAAAAAPHVQPLVTGPAAGEPRPAQDAAPKLDRPQQPSDAPLYKSFRSYLTAPQPPAQQQQQQSPQPDAAASWRPALPQSPTDHLDQEHDHSDAESQGSVHSRGSSLSQDSRLSKLSKKSVEYGKNPAAKDVRKIAEAPSTSESSPGFLQAPGPTSGQAHPPPPENLNLPPARSASGPGRGGSPRPLDPSPRAGLPRQGPMIWPPPAHGPGVPSSPGAGPWPPGGIPPNKMQQPRGPQGGVGEPPAAGVRQAPAGSPLHKPAMPSPGRPAAHALPAPGSPGSQRPMVPGPGGSAIRLQAPGIRMQHLPGHPQHPPPMRPGFRPPMQGHAPPNRPMLQPPPGHPPYRTQLPNQTGPPPIRRALRGGETRDLPPPAAQGVVPNFGNDQEQLAAQNGRNVRGQPLQLRPPSNPMLPIGPTRTIARPDAKPSPQDLIEPDSDTDSQGSGFSKNSKESKKSDVSRGSMTSAVSNVSARIGPPRQLQPLEGPPGSQSSMPPPQVAARGFEPPVAPEPDSDTESQGSKDSKISKKSDVSRISVKSRQSNVAGAYRGSGPSNVGAGPAAQSTNFASCGQYQPPYQVPIQPRGLTPAGPQSSQTEADAQGGGQIALSSNVQAEAQGIDEEEDKDEEQAEEEEHDGGMMVQEDNAYDLDGNKAEESYFVSQSITMEQTIEQTVTVERSVSTEQSYSTGVDVDCEAREVVGVDTEGELHGDADAHYEESQVVEASYEDDVYSEQSVAVVETVSVEQSYSAEVHIDYEVCDVVEADTENVLDVDADTHLDYEENQSLAVSREENNSVEQASTKSDLDIQESANVEDERDDAVQALSVEQGVDVEQSASMEEPVTVEKSYSAEVDVDYDTREDVDVNTGNEFDIDANVDYEDNETLEVSHDESFEGEENMEFGEEYDEEQIPVAEQEYEEDNEVDQGVDISYKQHTELEGETQFEENVDMEDDEDPAMQMPYDESRDLDDSYAEDVTNASYEESHEVSYAEEVQITEQVTYTQNVRTEEHEVYKVADVYEGNDIGYGYSMAFAYSGQVEEYQDHETYESQDREYNGEEEEEEEEEEAEGPNYAAVERHDFINNWLQGPGTSEEEPAYEDFRRPQPQPSGAPPPSARRRPAPGGRGRGRGADPSSYAPYADNNSYDPSYDPPYDPSDGPSYHDPRAPVQIHAQDRAMAPPQNQPQPQYSNQAPSKSNMSKVKGFLKSNFGNVKTIFGPIAGAITGEIVKQSFSAINQDQSQAGSGSGGGQDQGLERLMEAAINKATNLAINEAMAPAYRGAMAGGARGRGPMMRGGMPPGWARGMAPPIRGGLPPGRGGPPMRGGYPGQGPFRGGRGRPPGGPPMAQPGY